MSKYLGRSFGRSFGVRYIANLAQELDLPITPEVLKGQTFQGLAARPLDYSSEEDFAERYLLQEVFSKYPFNLGVDRRQAAIDKFLACEVSCAAANLRYEYWSMSSSVLQGTVRRARKLIRKVLGKFNLNELYSSSNFGPGASTSLRRILSSKQNKWVRSSHITEAALPYYSAFYKTSNIEGLPHEVQIVRGNKVTTVPKSSTTDRVIAIEPDWNMFFQKGVGAMIRRRLQHHCGLLTPDAQEKNKLLACRGSLDESYATIDLSSASDTISIFVVAALLPEDWFKHICALRSPFGEIGEKVINYEKISSMGNGFTFELETLIFWALSQAVCVDRTTLAYGDDLLVPSEYFHDFCGVLESFGFTPNAKKSFHSDHPFRESCGGHYFKGTDVSPFYVRALPWQASTTISIANQSLLWELTSGHLGRFQSSRKMVRGVTPRRLRGPFGLEGCLWCNWDEATPKWFRDFQSWEIQVVSRVHRYTDLSDFTGSYLYKLWEGSPDLESSIYASPIHRESVGRAYVDREGWVQLPA